MVTVYDTSSPWRVVTGSVSEVLDYAATGSVVPATIKGIVGDIGSISIIYHS